MRELRGPRVQNTLLYIFINFRKKKNNCSFGGIHTIIAGHIAVTILELGRFVLEVAGIWHDHVSVADAHHFTPLFAAVASL